MGWGDLKFALHVERTGGGHARIFQQVGDFVELVVFRLEALALAELLQLGLAHGHNGDSPVVFYHHLGIFAG